MAAITAPAGFIEHAVRSLSAEAFSGNLAPRDWVIRQGPTRRAHLLVIETRNGTAALARHQTGVQRTCAAVAAGRASTAIFRSKPARKAIWWRFPKIC